MSRMMFEQDEERKQLEEENLMYHRIMQDGKLNEEGYLIEPPADMTAEEAAYYRKLLRTNHGRIRYTV